MGLPAFDADRRSVHRRAVALGAHVKTGARPRVACVVRNISASGALIEFQSDIHLPERFRLDIDADLFEVDCVLRHGDGRRFGVEFTSNRQGAVALYGG